MCSAGNHILTGYEKQISNLTEDLSECQEAVAAAKEAVKCQKDAVAKNNKEINHEHARSEKITKAIADKNLKIQELKHKIAKVRDNFHVSCGASNM